jgi:protein phosphatase
MRRANNQDSHTVVLAEDDQGWRQGGHVFMVADGMGAHAAGELASKLAVEKVPHLYRHYRDLPPHEALHRAIIEANGEIHRRGLANADFRAMGTTASILVLFPKGALVGHVGDSRVYRLRGDQLDQLTFDHSLQWELRSMGRLAEDSDLARSIPKNVITRSLGPNADVVVDIEGPFPLELGDTFLLCSDGLSGQVKDDEIGSLLAHLSPEEAAAALVDLANLRGGPDNITAVVVKVAGQGLVTEDQVGTAQRPTRKARGQSADLAAWVSAGVCLLLAFFLWFADLRAPAGVSALGGIVSLAIGATVRLRRRRPATRTTAEQQSLGQGPYVHVACTASDEFGRTLSATLAELREAAEQEGWEVRWSVFDDYQRRAESAWAAADYPEAIRGYAKAISFMMDELREQQNRRDDDSSVDY